MIYIYRVIYELHKSEFFFFIAIRNITNIASEDKWLNKIVNFINKIYKYLGQEFYRN